MAGSGILDEGLPSFRVSTLRAASSSPQNSLEAGFEVATLQNGAIAYVFDQASEYRWFEDSVAAPSDPTVIIPLGQPTTLPGRWIQLSIGPQGPQGPQGSQGPQGDTGAQGFQGSTGTSGVQGSQGFQGAQGPAGDTGFQGVSGAQGSQGIQGGIDSHALIQDATNSGIDHPGGSVWIPLELVPGTWWAQPSGGWTIAFADVGPIVNNSGVTKRVLARATGRFLSSGTTAWGWSLNGANPTRSYVLQNGSTQEVSEVIDVPDGQSVWPYLFDSVPFAVIMNRGAVLELLELN